MPPHAPGVRGFCQCIKLTFNLYNIGVKKKYLTPMTFYSMIAKVHIA